MADRLADQPNRWLAVVQAFEEWLRRQQSA
jgi:hypothetical protein